MLQKIDVDEFLKNNFQVPDKEKFQELGRKLALHKMNDEIIELNFNRGPLLYALVSKLKPKKILEFGTGAGYGTMSMAWAMKDFDIDGKIFTIDRFPNEKQWSRPIDWGEGILNEEISNKEVWEKSIPKEWRKKIKTLSGYSGQIMAKNDFFGTDFAFIDGGHFYQAVKHDFYAFLKNSSKNFAVLFDDYIERESYGVKDFVDKDLSKWFDVKLIDTDSDKILFHKGVTKNIEYGMCLLDNNSMKVAKKEIIDEMEDDIKKYRKFEKRMILREKINKKLPFLSNRKLNFR